jgi:hypothetical protein
MAALFPGGARDVAHVLVSRNGATSLPHNPRARPTALSREPERGHKGPVWLAWSGRSGRNLPRLHRLGPEGPKGAAGDKVTLKAERVVDGSVSGQEPLG